jgi:hypothetical protein
MAPHCPAWEWVESDKPEQREVRCDFDDDGKPIGDVWPGWRVVKANQKEYLKSGHVKIERDFETLGRQGECTALAGCQFVCEAGCK